MKSDSTRPSLDKNNTTASKKGNELSEQELSGVDFAEEGSPSSTDLKPKSAEDDALPNPLSSQAPTSSANIPAAKTEDEVFADFPELDDIQPAVERKEDEIPFIPKHSPVKRKSGSKNKLKKSSGLKPKSTEDDKLPNPTTNRDTVSSVNISEAKTEDEVFADFPELDDAQPAEERKETENVPEEEQEIKPARVVPPSGFLTKIEKIAISALCIVLALGAILTLNYLSNRVPTRSRHAKKIDFPISGKIIKITAVSTYWREPILDGENADVVRRGTKMIPILKLRLSSKSGAIRVFFRNEAGLLIGDGITRAVQGNSEISFAATAGFEDMGMHTAYRAGDGKRWIAQVFEGPSATAPLAEFSKVLETEISTQIH